MTAPNWQDTFQDGETFAPRVIDRLTQLGSGGGGGGSVTSVSAGDSLISVGGTSTDPTVSLGGLDTDGTLAGNSDVKVPSQKAVKTYVTAHSGGSDKLGLTPTAVKTSAYGASAGDFVPVDTTSGSVTITLPNAPADGSVVAVKHVIQGSTNTVTVACAGSDVYNKASGVTSATLSLLAQGLLLQYKSSSAVWYVIADDLALSQLDLRFQPLDGTLTAFGALTIAANKLVYGTGTDAFALTDLTSFVRTLLDDADAATARNTLGAAALLGFCNYNPGSASTYTTSSGTFADADATNLTVTFTVPASGNVIVSLSAVLDVRTSSTLAWNLRSGGSDVSGTACSVGFIAAQIVERVTHRIYITGLTPGASVTYRWGYARTFGSGVTQFFAGGANGGAVMEVWSA